MYRGGHGDVHFWVRSINLSDPIKPGIFSCFFSHYNATTARPDYQSYYEREGSSGNRDRSAEYTERRPSLSSLQIIWFLDSSRVCLDSGILDFGSLGTQDSERAQIFSENLFIFPGFLFPFSLLGFECLVVTPSLGEKNEKFGNPDLRAVLASCDHIVYFSR